MATCPTCFTRFPDTERVCPADGAELVADETLKAPDLEPGQVVGEYRIEGKIGEGGFGTVYRAIHPVIGKAAAIKVLSPQYSANPVMVTRFIDEARAVNKIHHRGIIDIFAFGKLDDKRHYYIMELLDGRPLDVYLKQRGALRPEEALPILRQIARALDAAHAAGIAHRDLKPENVFLVFDEDGSVFPKLLDFGIAKLLGDSRGTKTRTGTPMGTPYYMSPEQCRGKNVDHRTDIYSFGVMAHYMLTGQFPFHGDDVMDVLMKQVSSPAPPMSSVMPALPPALDAPVLRMLAKEPADRPQSVGAAVDALVEAARTVGIEVPAVAMRSSEKLPRVGSAPTVPKGGRTDIAQAATLPQLDSSTSPSESETLRAAEARPDRRPLIAALSAVALVAIGAGAAVLILSQRSPAISVASASPPITEPQPPAAVPTGATTPAATVTVAPTPPSADIDLRVQSTPEGVEVWRGDQKLGTAPGPIKLARGNDEVELVFSAKGYKSSKIKIRPVDNVVVPVTLDKDRSPQAGKKATGGGKNGELEF
jgi:serine/threonine-protein kinase